MRKTDKICRGGICPFGDELSGFVRYRCDILIYEAGRWANRGVRACSADISRDTVGFGVIAFTEGVFWGKERLNEIRRNNPRIVLAINHWADNGILWRIHIYENTLYVSNVGLSGGDTIRVVVYRDIVCLDKICSQENNHLVIYIDNGVDMLFGDNELCDGVTYLK